MTTAQKSNRDIGAENLSKLQAWLDAADVIPERGGRANISAIAVAAGLDRQVLYRDEAKEAIREAVESKGLGMPAQQRGPGGDIVPVWATQRIKDLEEQLAVVKAEVRDLRERLLRYAHLEQHMTETGMLPR
jgi:hypothetical protein